MRIDENFYVTPTVKTVEISVQGIICDSPVTGLKNESYEDGSTEGWFNN